MTRADILEFMRSHSLAVQASVSPLGAPQAAVVGFIVTDDFEIVFDTVDTTRKVVNLRRSARRALVIGGMVNGDERTVQYEGIADEPTGTDLERLKELYVVRFPDTFVSSRGGSALAISTSLRQRSLSLRSEQRTCVAVGTAIIPPPPAAQIRMYRIAALSSHVG